MNEPLSNSSSIAYETGRVVKNTNGRLFGFCGYSSNVAAQFIQVHDSQTIPAAGAIPVAVFAVGGASNFAVDFGLRGRVFTKGIVICNSTTAQTLTIGAADLWVDAQYL